METTGLTTAQNLLIDFQNTFRAPEGTSHCLTIDEDTHLILNIALEDSEKKLVWLSVHFSDSDLTKDYSVLKDELVLEVITWLASQ